MLEGFIMFGLLKIREEKITSVSFLLGCWRCYQCFPQHLKPFSFQDFALMFVGGSFFGLPQRENIQAGESDHIFLRAFVE